VWPVPAGVLAGIGILLAVWLMETGVPPVEPPPPRSSVTGQKPPIISAPNARLRAPRDQVGVLLPPRPDAADITRRLEQPGQTPKVGPTVTPAKPMIAIVIDDMGFDRVNTARAVRLPAAVTLAYLPYAPEVGRQVRHARLRGHDVILHLPMEANSHDGHPGRHVLAVDSGQDAMLRHLDDMLGRFSGYIGVNNHMGSRFTGDASRMKLVLSELKRRGLFFLDSRTSGRSVGEAAAISVGLPYAVRDVFLDHDADADAIRARISDTERVAREKGWSIAIGHPRTLTMDIVEPWLAEIGQRGFRLVPVARLLKRPPGKRLARIETSE
jgi:polysaccharide deacetylase 2 family uncharacterized protein YibQ